MWVIRSTHYREKKTLIVDGYKMHLVVVFITGSALCDGNNDKLALKCHHYLALFVLWHSNKSDYYM